MSAKHIYRGVDFQLPRRQLHMHWHLLTEQFLQLAMHLSWDSESSERAFCFQTVLTIPTEHGYQTQCMVSTIVEETTYVIYFCL